MVARRNRLAGIVPPSLSDVAAAVCTDSTKVRLEIYELTKSRLEFELTRYKELSQRASILLGATGLSLTVAFVVGGGALAKANGKLLPLLALLAGILGLLAAAAALRVLLVARDYSFPSGSTIFDGGIIQAATDHDEDEDVRHAEYVEHLTPHFWECVQRNTAANTVKASAVKEAQILYGVFLGCLAVLAAAFFLTSGAV